MFKRTAQDLGLDIVLNTISSYSLSSAGASLIKNAIPMFDKEVYKQRQDRVSEVILSLTESQTEQIYAETFPDISAVFINLVNNPTASLSGEEIFSVATFVRSAELLRKILNCHPVNTSLTSGANCIIEEIDSDLLYMAQEVFKILESPGNVKESYPTVKALRDKAEKIRVDRTKVASQLMKDNSRIMQGENAVLRDGRIVLPVRNDMHGNVEGYVQGASQSGNTVFMEPFRLIDMNNAVIMAFQEIEVEIARLLGMLSSLVRGCENKLRILQSQVANADFLYAFASWIRENNCCRVLEIEEDVCNLINARHPLLKDRCVPIDFKVDSSFKAVVLTGPNAGGKTVTMKTVGLFSLLNQICGYIPASDGSSMRLFDRVFTDIGDDQSIENHLSTFSGHMASIGFILRSITPDSLVILDELGSGTDPQEGAALARSIMEFCIKKAALTLTTSHHGVLKQFAYSSDEVLNASMEFDDKTLEPTFRVINGLPGESHAIDTAKRMHLPKSVTLNAQKYMGKEAVKISSIIRGLESKRREADLLEEEIKKRLTDAKDYEKRLEAENRRLKALENKLKTQMLSDFDDQLKESRKELENLVKELREGEITKEKTAKVKQYILSQEEKRGALKSELEEREKQLDKQDYETLIQSADNVELEVGMDVLCGQYKREGTIVRKEKNGKWQVAIGPMKFVFKETELTVPNKTPEKKTSYSFDKGSSAPRPKLDLDLRGYRLLEALETIEQQIEACCVHGITNFSIIHGYGEGKLSTGIHNYLRTCKTVSEYHFARPEDGGQGKTYVTLK